MQFRTVALLGLAFTLSSPATAPWLRGEETSASEGEAKQEKITYDDHIQPIFRQKCASCHNPDKRSSGLDLTSYVSLMQGGSAGDAIDPGSPDGSYLYMLVAHDSEPFMPPESDRLPDETVSLISRWIEQGALENSGSKPLAQKKPRPSLALTESPTERPAVMPLPGRLEKDPVITPPVPGVITAVATSPWAPVAAVASQRQVLLYHTESLELLGVLPFPEGIPYSLRFSRNGSLLLAGGGRSGASGRVVVWNIATGERVFEVGDELDAVLAADISADQSMIALGGPQKVVRVYGTADGNLLFELRKHTDWIYSLEFSPDGVLLATGDRSGNLLVWEGFTGREYLDFKGHTDAVTGVSWRADSNVLASASEDGSVRIWELENGTQVKNWNAHPGGVTSLEFARDGRLVTSGRDRVSTLWGTDWNQQQQFAGFPDIIVQVTFCDETNRAAIADWTGAIRVFTLGDDVPAGELIANPPSLSSRLDEANLRLSQKREELAPLQATYDSAQEKSVSAIMTAEEAQAAYQNRMSKKSSLQEALEMLSRQHAELQKSEKPVRERLAGLETAAPKIQQAADLLQNSVETLGDSPARAELTQVAQDAARLSELHAAELVQSKKQVGKLERNLRDNDEAQKTSRVAVASLDEQIPELQKRLDEALTNQKGVDETFQAAQAALAPVQAEVAQAMEDVQRWQDELQFVSEMRKLQADQDELEQQSVTVESRWQELSEQLAGLQTQRNESMTEQSNLIQLEQMAAQELSAAQRDHDQAVMAQKQQAESAELAKRHVEELKAATQTLGMAVEKAQVAATQAVDEELEGAAKKLQELLTKKEAELADLGTAQSTAADKAQEADQALAASRQRLKAAQKKGELARTEQITARQQLDQLTADLAELQGQVDESARAVESLQEQLEALQQQQLAARQL